MTYSRTDGCGTHGLVIENEDHVSIDSNSRKNVIILHVDGGSGPASAIISFPVDVIRKILQSLPRSNEI